METISEKTALLKFYLEAGVDETIGDAPVNRFATRPPMTPEASPTARPRPVAAGKTAVAIQSVAPSVSLSEGIQKAKKLAGDSTTIAELQTALENFDGCSLKKGATNTVFASGKPGSRLMVIDRQPAVDEDRNGMPFAGEAGELLSKMLAAIGLDQADVYLASALPWRPPGGRMPTDEEISLCLPFTERHIALANPEFLLLCGEAGGYLMKKKAGINKLRGKWAQLQFEDTQLKALAIFHPGFLLEHPTAKKYAWADLLTLKAALETSA
ncbi:MAG: uracil-DNA glycosylase [Sneathiella sp.]|nr:MAG: uracil-DNA glycosylase [Sneathiella sp.]